jgi:poly-gamma-glutamate synthesis protein (capsule biosynthesis protein)
VHGILEKEIVDIMKSSDIMVANNEFTVSNRGSKLPNKYYTFRAKPERLSIYDEMGVDIVSIANNHVYDYGEDAFLDMLGHLKEYDMPYVGGGKNIDEATRPYYFVANGYKIAFIAATRAEKYILTPEATETSSGVFRAYDPTLLLNTISDVKKTSDFVIVLMHWGREDSHELEQVQIDTGKMYIDAGADLLVGSHAHVLQGMEFYNGKLIAHNLGDFIFNRETKDTGILSVTINDEGNMSYKFIPCFQSNFKTILLNDKDKDMVISNMRSYSINTFFDGDGKFYVSN